jgi:hypothetical protein
VTGGSSLAASSPQIARPEAGRYESNVSLPASCHRCLRGLAETELGNPPTIV